MLTRLLVCGAVACTRLGELAWSRGNIASAGPATEGAWSRRTYPLMVALHAAVIGLTLVRGGRTRRGWLALLIAAQPLRLWVLGTLGRRWNTRAAVPRDMEVAINGPYAFVRHPNYAVVAVELAALPLAFGLLGLAVVATGANAALLALRIPEEEAALRQLRGWDAHFEDKKRFVPGLL